MLSEARRQADLEGRSTGAVDGKLRERYTVIRWLRSAPHQRTTCAEIARQIEGGDHARWASQYLPPEVQP